MADDIIMPSKYKRNDLTAEFIKTLLEYDSETGIFIWKYRYGMNTRAKGWNTKYAGKIAGRKKISTSYIEVAINEKFYSIHRLAWLYMVGEWPPNEIDHIDGNKENNKWDNLRSATRSQNCQNINTRKNKLGFKGVKFRKDLKSFPFSSKITIDKKEISLGYFETAEQAHAAYCEAAKKYHGEFAKY